MKKSLAMLLTLALVLAITPVAMADWGWDTPTGANSYTASVSLRDATQSQITNINLVAKKLSNIVVPCGSTFSFNDTVGPRNAANGYKNAKNGRGVYVRGGGTGQVASAIYLAVAQISGIRISEKSIYGYDYTENYVDSGEEAIVVDYNNDKDFAFAHPTANMKIEVWVTSSYINCEITVTPVSITTPEGADGEASIWLSGTSTLKNNVSRAANAINGTTLGYRDEFSFNNIVGPRTERYGYGSAVNGRGMKVTGGGVAQVASVIYMAIKDLSYIEILEKRTYENKYNQSYVLNEDDAILTDYNSGFDFRFRYLGFNTLYINVYVNSSNHLICEVSEY